MLDSGGMAEDVGHDEGMARLVDQRDMDVGLATSAEVVAVEVAVSLPAASRAESETVLEAKGVCVMVVSMLCNGIYGTRDDWLAVPSQFLWMARQTLHHSSQP